MHGRLKIKTTAEQAAEKQKERDEKRKLYLAGLTKAFDKRSSKTYDKEGLKITAQLLIANPDAATLWNFRREILLDMNSDGDEAWTKLLKEELLMVESCLMKNPKSYGAWHHRCWIMKKFPIPPWNAELELCNQYLKLDERNFHCWDYRRFITTGSHQQPEDELLISKQLIERNLSNYSAWHYRSKLLPIVYPPSASTPHPVPVNVLVKELKTVVEAVFTDPSDQSPWFFLRWLINQQERNPRFMQIGYDDNDGGCLICIFSQPLSMNDAPVLFINGEERSNIDWFSPSGESFSYVWVTKLKLSSSCEASNITVSRIGSEKKTVTVPAGSTHYVEWVTELGVCGEDLSDLTRSTLEEVKENCVTLDELDPNNKWVLLTLVDILWALDARSYKDKIASYLSQLEALDFLRANYYNDMKSKLAMETSLTTYRIMAERDTTFNLKDSGLSRIPFSHLLACTVSVDLSNNEIVSLNPLKNLVACRELILDSNRISELSPLCGITSLCKLSIANNEITSFDQFRSLKNLCKLEMLNVSSNPVCSNVDFENEINEILQFIKSIKVI